VSVSAAGTQLTFKFGNVSLPVVDSVGLKKKHAIRFERSILSIPGSLAGPRWSEAGWDFDRGACGGAGGPD
jgi:hypothetical protein